MFCVSCLSLTFTTTTTTACRYRIATVEALSLTQRNTISWTGRQTKVVKQTSRIWMEEARMRGLNNNEIKHNSVVELNVIVSHHLTLKHLKCFTFVGRAFLQITYVPCLLCVIFHENWTWNNKDTQHISFQRLTVRNAFSSVRQQNVIKTEW